MDEEDLKCSLCLEIFTLPVKLTRCGHSFCGQCLAGMAEATWPCPKCRTVQNQTPEQLPRNYGLEPIVEKFKSSRKTICATHDLKRNFVSALAVISMTLGHRANKTFISRLFQTWSTSLPWMCSCWYVWWYRSKWLRYNQFDWVRVNIERSIGQIGWPFQWNWRRVENKESICSICSATNHEFLVMKIFWS